MVREELPLDHLMILQLGTTELTVQIEGDCCALLATEGPDKDVQATVPPQGLIIGREASNGLCIHDPQISAFHCEVRLVPDQGFILDDKYSTNRTWLRLAPDGQPSKRHVLRIQDLFKVGSTLFHVVDPASIAVEPAQSRSVPSDRSRRGGSMQVMAMPTQHHPAISSRSSRLEEDDEGDVDDSEWRRVHSDEIDIGDGEDISAPGMIGSALGSSGASSDIDEAGVPHAPQLRWEPFMEGETRPVLSPEEYARRVTASRRRMHADAEARRSIHSGGELHLSSQDAGMFDLRERELSSLQQRMRNSRAQTAYTLQQQRPSERRDEDLCKICYDRDIDVVLYPCGHFVLCRWCAQKVSDCPVCRFVITDVIRTYKA